VEVDLIVGKLHRMWCIASEYDEDGRLHIDTPEMYDKIMELPGLAGALLKIDWLAEKPDVGLYCPRIERWQSSTAHKRAKEREKKRNQRLRKPNVPHLSPDVPGDTRGQTGDKSGHHRDSVPNTDTDTDTESISKPPLPPKGAKQRIEWNDGVWSGISDTNRTEWTSAYPSVNIDGELAKATAWLRSNPDRAGKRNWSRFLNGWFARAHERSAVRNAGSGKPAGLRLGDGSFGDEEYKISSIV
jgi:hypothetical protein